MDFSEQLHRIKRKLQSVRKLDPKGKRSFGADTHRYRLGKPLSEERIKDFETKCRITLPEDYRAFLTTVGGSIDDKYSGAGPYYGIYSLKHIEDDCGDSSSFKEFVQKLIAPCTVFPNMDKEEWEKANDEEEYYPYHGMMVFGTQGCTYQMMLVLNGKYRGRVVYIDEERSGLPFFTYEKNFLDWYERWLDEILAGYDLEWFGFRIGGDSQTLIRLFRETNDESLQQSCIGSFSKFPRLDETSLSFLETAVQAGSSPIKCQAIQMLAKFDYSRSKPYLAQAIFGKENDKLAAFKAIHLYAEKHRNDWAEQVLAVLPEIKEEETLDFATYILENNKGFLNTLMAIPDPPPFVLIRIIEKLAKNNKTDCLEFFYRGLDNPSDTIVCRTLRALRIMKTFVEPGFLPYFEKLIDKYSMQYEKRKQDNPQDEELMMEESSYRMTQKFPRLAWSPQVIESKILWWLHSCLKPYDYNADALVMKMSELSHEAIAHLAKEDLERRIRICNKRKKRKTLWTKLRRLLFLK